MKFIITFIFSFTITLGVAQSSMFVHTATAATIASDASTIDHPDLNNNPDAKLLVTHNWNPGNGTGVYNNKNTGVFWNNGTNRWMVYNEDGTDMIENTSYNIYVAQGNEVYLHIADLANQGSFDDYTVLNHPDLNNNPNALIQLTTYYNANNLRNDHPYGVWYDEVQGRWIIYNESLVAIPLDTAFFVGIGGGDGVSVKHTATAANITLNWTVIDHPLLNGNENAVFTFNHNWGASGDSSNIIMNEILGAWYTGTNWAIFNEDTSDMPENVEFDLFILDPSLGTLDNTLESLTVYPNPVSSQLNIQNNKQISQIEIYNSLGQQILLLEGNSNNMQIDVSKLTSGIYFATVRSENGSKTIKIIKD